MPPEKETSDYTAPLKRLSITRRLETHRRALGRHENRGTHKFRRRPLGDHPASTGREAYLPRSFLNDSTPAPAPAPAPAPRHSAEQSCDGYHPQGVPAPLARRVFLLLFVLFVLLVLLVLKGSTNPAWRQSWSPPSAAERVGGGGGEEVRK